MRDLKMRHQNAGVENAGPSSMESYLAIKCANDVRHEDGEQLVVQPRHFAKRGIDEYQAR